MTIQVTSPFYEAAMKSGPKEWKPFPKQADFISLPFDIEEALFGGAAGPGKSELLVLLPLIYGFHQHPLYKGILLRRTFPELESEIILRSKLFYPSTGALYNESKRRWSFPSGAYEQFGHAEREDDIRKYDTAQYNLVRFDELTSFLEFQYLYLTLTRRRSATADLPAIARSASNPGNIGHIFTRKRFIDPFPQGGRVLYDSETGLRRFFLQALGSDNPQLLINNPNYFSGMKDLGEAEYRAKALGDWYTFQGQVFTEWRIAPFPGEPEYAQHVVSPFTIPEWWPRFLAVDWGWKAWTFAIWFALAPTGKLYIYRTYAEKGKYIPEWIGEILNLTSDEEMEQMQDMALCHSAAQHRGEPHTIEQQVNEALKDREIRKRFRLGKKDRIGGKMLVHEFLRWKQKPKMVKEIHGAFNPDYANYIFRNYGKRAYESYLDAFTEPEEEKNLPRLQILTHSPEGRENKEIIDCIPQCQYVEKGEKDKSPEDVAEFDGDDPYDTLRIGLELVDKYLETAKKTEGYLNAKGKILSNYDKSGDTHSMYMALRRLESQNQGPRPIRRFHR